MIVADASVLIEYLFASNSTVDEALHGDAVAAPQLVLLEILSFARRRGYDSIAIPLDELADLVELFDHWNVVGRCWELRHNLTPYDASYVALAELLDAPLLTSDARVARAPGVRCEVRVLRSVGNDA